MRMGQWLWFVAVVAGCVFAPVLAGDAWACACCARSDDWMRWSGGSEFEREEIVGLALSRGVLIEGVGERDPLYLNRPVIVNGTGQETGDWEVAIGTGEADSLSTLRFTPEGPWEFFQTYPGPWPGKLKSEVQLYKEVMIAGTVEFGGSLATTLGHATLPARLLFQGQGNRCFAGADFSQWQLRFVVPRPDGDITFVGSG